ncbi:unnamed protein product [Hyaloperonospora brassicae]|uniref:RxLR effector candidate protein n=1 Tax=Hyaloperonospora brassicae TaxID=162125 RepID=A0AAV0UQ48_HYABA|nr:unnamed protein product [Hyaloperonospora brassicae]
MRLHVVLALFGATFVASCITCTGADHYLAEDRHDESIDIRRLRQETTRAYEESLDGGPLYKKQKHEEQSSREAPSPAKVPGRVQLTAAQTKKLYKKLAALSGDKEERFTLFKVFGWATLIGGVGGASALIYQALKKRSSMTSGVPGGMSATESVSVSGSDSMSGSSSGSMSGSGFESMSGSGFESMSGSALRERQQAQELQDLSDDW